MPRSSRIMPLRLNADGLSDNPAPRSGNGTFDLRRNGLTFTRSLAHDCELTGPMSRIIGPLLRRPILHAITTENNGFKTAAEQR